MLQFTEEQELLRKTLREFAKKEFTWERERHLDAIEVFPYEYYRAMADLRLMALPIPREYGGEDGTIVDLALVVEELARGSAAASNAYQLCVLFGGMLILGNGSSAQKAELLPQIAQGALKFATGITEPNAGSDVASLQMTARRLGDHYVLNGSKIYITGAGVADYIFTLARTDPELPKHRGLTIFLVPGDATGLTKRVMPKLGNRWIASCELYFDDVALSPDRILGGPDKVNHGWRQIMHVLDDERVCASAFFTGEAQRAMDLALEYAKERVQFGRPIGAFQAIQHLLADMATSIHAGRLMTYHVARLRERGAPCSHEAAMTKLFTAETSKKVALDGLQIMGGFGYMLEQPMQMLVRDTLLNTIAGGASQIMRNVIAGGLGLPRD